MFIIVPPDGHVNCIDGIVTELILLRALPGPPPPAPIGKKVPERQRKGHAIPPAKTQPPGVTTAVFIRGKAGLFRQHHGKGTAREGAAGMKDAVRRGRRPVGVGPDLPGEQPGTAVAAGTAAAVGTGGDPRTLQRHKDAFPGGSRGGHGPAAGMDGQRIALPGAVG